MWNAQYASALSTLLDVRALTSAVRLMNDATANGNPDTAIQQIRLMLSSTAHNARACAAPEIRAARAEARNSHRELADTLEQYFASLSESEPETSCGTANFLTAGQGVLKGFGAVLAMRVKVEDVGGGAELRPIEHHRDETAGAFHSAAAVAKAMLYEWGGTKSRARNFLLNDMRCIGEVAALRHLGDGKTLEGTSHGLASAVAVLSALLQQPVDQRFGFSGAITMTGGVGRVGGIPEKLRAASDHGLERVFLPSTTEDRTGSSEKTVNGKRITVERVDSLADVVKALGWSGAATACAQRLDTASLAVVGRTRAWMTSRSDPAAAKVLISAIGSSDPFGSYDQEKEQPDAVVRDGPLITLCDYLQPAAVHCLFTEDFEGRYRETCNEIIRRTPGLSGKIFPHRLVELRARAGGTIDPTDFSLIFPAFARILDEILARNTARSFFVNVSSGTPQMSIAWHMLAERVHLRGQHCTLLQKREHHYASGESMIREVWIPFF